MGDINEEKPDAEQVGLIQENGANREVEEEGGYDVAGNMNRMGREFKVINFDSGSRDHVLNDVTPCLSVAIFSSVVGCALTMGYNTGVINPPQVHIQDFIQEAREKRHGARFSDSALSWYWSGCVSCYFLTAPLGCFLGSWAIKKYGRLIPMWLNNVLMLLGALLQSGCLYFDSYEMFLLGRAITGVNNGANTVLCPTYLAEIAPKSIRGGIGALFQLSVISGVLLSFILGLESLLGNQDNWPYLFSVVILFGLIQCLTLPLSPESPRYILLEEQNLLKCRSLLKQLRPKDFDIENELVEIEDEITATRSIGDSPDWIDYIKKQRLRQPLCIATVMTISQHFSGINSLSVYSSPIIKAALPQDTVDSHPDLANYMVISSGFTSLLFTAISVRLIDRLGRKASHLMGLVGMALCMLFVSFFFSDLQVKDSQTCHGVQFPDWTNYLALVFLFVYVAFFGIGPAAVPWLITPELFTAAARARAVSIVTTINWICNFTVVFGFIPLQDALCGWVFLIFFSVTSVCIGFLSAKLPEVRGGDAIGKVIKNFEESV